MKDNLDELRDDHVSIFICDGWQDCLDLFHGVNWAKIENVNSNELDRICEEWWMIECEVNFVKITQRYIVF